MHHANLIWVTPQAEKVIMYCARVSSGDQTSENTKLLNYCMKNKHWSIFQMASMCVEIITTRAISPQILRHRSMNFQEFSLRYAKNLGLIHSEIRNQDYKNRQNSTEDVNQENTQWYLAREEMIFKLSQQTYNEGIERGLAKECMRNILPLSTETKLYMSGTLRDFIHYINLRTGNGTQKEHRLIAESIKEIFIKEFPIIGGIINDTK